MASSSTGEQWCQPLRLTAEWLAPHPLGRLAAGFIRWLTAAAIWGALDPASDVLYLYSEYVGGEAETAVHAAATQTRGKWVPGLIDPLANGRSPEDGRRLIQIYRNHGLALQSVDNPLESGILNVWERMQSGRLKVFGSLSKYLDERRLYRRDDKDQIIREHDHLQDAVRCLVSAVSRLRTKPKPVMPPPLPTSMGDRDWMA